MLYFLEGDNEFKERIWAITDEIEAIIKDPPLGWYDKLESLLAQIEEADLATNNYGYYTEILTDCADFLFSNEMWEQAGALYDKVRKVYQANTDKEDFSNYAMGIVQNRLADIAYITKDFELAELRYTEALESYSKVDENRTIPICGIYKYEVLSRLAEMYDTKNEFDKAEQAYMQAIDTYIRELTNIMCVDPTDINLPFYMHSESLLVNYYNLACLHADRGEMKMAECEYSTAVDGYRILSKNVPEAFEPILAQALYYLADLHQDMMEYDKAKAEFTEALEIYRRLALKRPTAYGEDIDDILQHLDDLRYK